MSSNKRITFNRVEVRLERKTINKISCKTVLTETTMDNSEDFCVECSDDELKNSTEPWEPDPEEVDRIYSMLAKGEIPELKWKCPGYRSPSPETTEEQKEENPETKFVNALQSGLVC